MVFHVLGMNQDETYTDMYTDCTAKSVKCKQTHIYNTKYMYFSPYNVQTVYIHEYTFIFVYVRVHTCSDHVYTTYIHSMYNFTFLWTCIIKRRSSTFRFEPMILCILASCLDHYAISVVVRCRIITVFVYFFIWSLVSYVWHRSPGAVAAAAGGGRRRSARQEQSACRS